MTQQSSKMVEVATEGGATAVLPGSVPAELAIIDGKYVVEEPLAMGGMAELFRARRIDGGGQVVIKLMLAQYAEHPEMVRLFDSEADVAARFRHPNIPRLVDRGQVAGRHYIAFEYIEGVCLAELVDSAVQSGRRMPLEVAVGILLQLLDALGHVHTEPPPRAGDDGPQGGVVHRDVTPYNVIIGRDGGVRLIDFGLAESTRPHSDRPRESSVRGTYAYMAPEQVVGIRCDARSDLFSVGIIAYELTTGVRLFQGTAPAIMRMIVEDPLVSPRVRRPDYPAGLERIVLRALARDPQSRPVSAVELSGELRKWLESARPDDREAGGRTAVRGFVERTLGIPGLLPGGTLQAAGLPRPQPVALPPEEGDDDDFLGSREAPANEEGIEPDSASAGPSPEELMQRRLEARGDDTPASEGTGYSGRDSRLPQAAVELEPGAEPSGEAQQLADEIIGTDWATADRIKTAPLMRRSDLMGIMAGRGASPRRAEEGARPADAGSARPADPVPATAAAPVAAPAPVSHPGPPAAAGPAGGAAVVPAAAGGRGVLVLVTLLLLLGMGGVALWYLGLLGPR